MKMIWDLGFGIWDLNDGSGRAEEKAEGERRKAKGKNGRRPAFEASAEPCRPNHLITYSPTHCGGEQPPAAITRSLDHFPEVPPCRA